MAPALTTPCGGRHINPEAAPGAVLEDLTSCGRNIVATGRAFGITRPVVYDILAKEGEGDLRDWPKTPHHQPPQTLLPEGRRETGHHRRERSSLNYRSPYEHLKAQLPDVDENIPFVVPILLDKVAVTLGPWSGYHVLVQHPWF